jgi:hypothetical protein
VETDERELGLLGEDGLQERLFVLCGNALVLGDEDMLQGIVDNGGGLEEAEADLRVCPLVCGKGVEVGCDRLNADHNELCRRGIKCEVLKDGIEALLDLVDCIDNSFNITKKATNNK